MIKNFYFDRICVVDNAQRKAMIQKFDRGVNIVTSPGKAEGNFVGKSTLLKSCFEALGADCHWNKNRWVKSSDAFYLLDFAIDGDSYRILRAGKFFKIVSMDTKKVLFATVRRDELGPYFAELLGMPMLLKGWDNKYEQTPPAYYFVTYFLDQKNIKPCKLACFDNFTQYKDFFSDALYQNVGLPFDFLRAKADHEMVKGELERQKGEIALLSRMEQQTQSIKNEAAIDEIESLKRVFEEKKSELETQIRRVESLRGKIQTAQNGLHHSEELLKEVISYINSMGEKSLYIPTHHRCPYCDSDIEFKEMQEYINKALPVDEMRCEQISLESKIVEYRRNLSFLEEKYRFEYEKLEQLKSSIFGQKKEIDDALKAMGTSALLAAINEKKVAANKLLEATKGDERKAAKLAKMANESKSDIDTRYVENINQLHAKHHACSVDISGVSALDSVFQTDGNEDNIGMVLWLFAINKTRSEQTKAFSDFQFVRFPLVLDDAPNADFSEDIKKMLFDLALDSVAEEQQFIYSQVGFNRDYISHNPKAKVIMFENEQFSLLKTEQYQDALKLIEETESFPALSDRENDN